MDHVICAACKALDPNCIFCDGLGHHALNKSRRHRKEPAMTAPTPAPANDDADLIAWAAQQTWSSFATDVAARAKRFGLSDKQRASLQSMRAKTDDRTSGALAKLRNVTNKAVEGFAGVVAIMDHIEASGNKRPRVTLQTEGGRTVKIRRNTYGVNMGSDSLNFDELWAGMINKHGQWNPTEKAKRLDAEAKADYWALLQALQADAKAVFAENGKRTGTCACCGRPLSNDESVQRGIGPECWVKMGFA